MPTFLGPLVDFTQRLNLVLLTLPLNLRLTVLQVWPARLPCVYDLTCRPVFLDMRIVLAMDLSFFFGIQNFKKKVF